MLALKMITFLHLLLLCSFVYCNASSAQKSDETMNFYHSTGVSGPSLPQHEVQALQELLKELGGTISVNRSSCLETKNWIAGVINVTASCPCTSGICHIVEINASPSDAPLSRGLAPRVPSSYSPSSMSTIIDTVAKLTFLKTLKLSNMGFQSSMPHSLGKLSLLESLDLSTDNLTGKIPSTIGNLRFLKKLDLSGNQLIGRIPSYIGDLHSLQMLSLRKNFLEGSIPALKNLVHLTSLDLSFNNFTGPIPDALGNQLLMLEFVYLNDNRLSGPLPEALGNLTKLAFLDVGANFLTGEIPRTFNQLASLGYFGVYGNNMSGKIPRFITKWTRLRQLELLGNNFEGPLPDEIFTMGNLEMLDVSDLNLRNDYYYDFPLANFTNMEYLILRNCSISGKMPSNIGNFTPLNYLDLSFNNLSGVIPSSLNKLLLNTILLNNNNLQGEIPNLKSRPRAGDFSFNKFTQERGMEFEDKYVNYFNCCAIENVSNMVFPQDLTTTHFCNKSKENTYLHINCGGSQPVSKHGATYEKDNGISTFHVNNNWAYSCSGEGPSNSANLSCGIGFSDTVLFATARICPVSLKYYGCLRNGKYDVTLHFAEIEYNKKEDYSILFKRIFDIYIQGKRKVKDFNIVQEAGGPDKNFSKNFLAIDVTDHILEIHLYWAGKGTWGNNGVLISGIAVTPSKSGVGPLEIAMIAVACVVFLGLVVLALAWHMGWIGNKSLYEKRIDIRGKKVSIKQLINATKKFSHKKEIGKGGFGMVYKAEVAGEVIAVKKLSPRSKQGIEEFRRELYTLKSLRHRNLVELFDGYSDNGYHLLVYEYMENKSLADILFDPNSKLRLNWEVRYKICKDIAIGLKFLHEETHLQIIHGDIKINNILLDGALNGKISDFGLAKVYVEDDPSTVVKIGGTTGYMAPEYATQGIMTHKVDVYSFGVVLLEIISGKRNAQYKERQESEFLLDTAYVLHKNGRTMDLVDPDLRDDIREKKTYHQAKTLLFLAMMCTSLSHSLRPTMSEVVSVLEGEKTIEQVSDDHSVASTSHLITGSSSKSSITEKNWTSCDVSPTSTDVSSFTTTAYFVIKDKDVKKDPVLPSSTLEVSDETRAN